LTGSLRSNFFFKKNQNDVVLGKKNKTKVNGLQQGFVGSHRVFSSPVFFQPGPVSVPGRVLKLWFNLKVAKMLVEGILENSK
jgi:hypothetical protein